MRRLLKRRQSKLRTLKTLQQPQVQQLQTLTMVLVQLQLQMQVQLHQTKVAQAQAIQVTSMVALAQLAVVQTQVQPYHKPATRRLQAHCLVQA